MMYAGPAAGLTVLSSRNSLCPGIPSTLVTLRCKTQQALLSAYICLASWRHPFFHCFCEIRPEGAAVCAHYVLKPFLCFFEGRLAVDSPVSTSICTKAGEMDSQW